MHLEILSSLDAHAFLMALECFVARRNKLRVIIMGNDTNFQGDTKELKELWQKINQDQLQRSQYETQFIFNTPLAPHRNGCVEGMVGAAK